ncbi:MAG: alpha/beta fold hydrolase [Burkholderiaceae bacterium]|nr:alpha/beta fold hydrolase [Burkholderiaceae bacterium]
MIARLQQLIALSLLAIAGAWKWYAWPDFGLIVIGFLAAAGVYIAYFALLFIAIHYLNRTDPQPRASLAELLRAWLREAIAAFRIFLWRQPFRHQAVPDFLPVHQQRGVVFIHGFVCNRGFWNPWMARLKAQNRAFVAVNLEPIFGSIDDYAPRIEAAVTQLTRATGLPPTLICHSMGGLAARAWLRAAPEGDARVDRIITIGTPHHGTLLSQRQLHQNTRQMERFSDWTQQLDADEPATRRARFICWYGNCDNIVVPTSTAMLAGADNRLVTAHGHVSLAFDERVMRESMALLVNPVDVPVI